MPFPKMKIAIVEIMPYPYFIGGGKTHIDNLASYLIKKGHEVYVISSKSKEKILEHPKEINLINVGLKHRKFKGNLLSYLYRIIFEIFFVINAGIELKKIKPDIVNTQSLITTSLPCSIFNIPFVATVHGIFESGFRKIWELKNKRSVSKFSFFYKLIEKYNVKKCRAIICLGKRTLDYYKQFNKNRFIIPNGVNTDIFYNMELKRDKDLIFVGRFTEQKGILNLVKAMDYLKDNKLILVGDGDLREEILKIIKNQNITYLGTKGQEEIARLFNISKFQIMPSEFEGLPISLLESMACGCIPITTDVGESGSVIKNEVNGFLMENNKPEEIAKVLKQAEKENLGLISKNCTKTIEENYDWNVLSDKFIEVYNKALGK